MTTDPLTQDDVAELAAYRAGCLQLAYDPHTAESVHVVGDNWDTGEPEVWVHETYDGVPVWHCHDCLRVTLARNSDPDTCKGCGSVHLYALHKDEFCTDEEHL